MAVFMAWLALEKGWASIGRRPSASPDNRAKPSLGLESTRRRPGSSDDAEHEEHQPAEAHQQAHAPEPTFPGEHGDRRQGDRDLQERHTARENHVSIEVVLA